jgi:hypothetical protein
VDQKCFRLPLSGWSANRTWDYFTFARHSTRIRIQSPTLSVIVKREHRLAKSSGRQLVAVSFDDAARFRARVHAVVNHLYAVDEDF